MRAAVPAPDEKAATPWLASAREQAAELLPGKRANKLLTSGSCAAAGEGLLSRRWWSASPSASHGNGERVRLELRSAMAAQR